MGSLFGGYFRRKGGSNSRGTLLGGAAGRGKSAPKAIMLEKPQLPPPVTEEDTPTLPPNASSPQRSQEAASQQAGFWGGFLAEPEASVESTAQSAPAADKTSEQRLGWLLEFMEEDPQPTVSKHSPSEVEPASPTPTCSPVYHIKEQTFQPSVPHHQVSTSATDEPRQEAHALESELASEGTESVRKSDTLTSGPDTQLVFGGASPMGLLMEDVVSKTLLRQGVITMAQGLLAARQRKQPSNEPLWRAFIGTEGINQERLFDEVARISGFRRVPIEVNKPAEAFVHAVIQLFPADIVDGLKRLHVLPYELEMDPDGSNHTLLAATPDPANPNILVLMQRLGLSIQCLYASQAEVERKWEHVAAYAAQLSDEEDAKEVVDANGSLTEAYNESDEVTPTTPTSAIVEGAPSETVMDEEPLGSPEAEVMHLRLGPDGSFGGFVAATPPPKADGTPDTTLTAAVGDGLPSGDVVIASVDNPMSEADEALASSALPETREESTVAKETDFASDTEVPEVKTKDRVVLRLMRTQRVDPRQVLMAQELQADEDSKESLWRTLTRVNGVDRDAVFAEAARVYAFRTAQLGPEQPDPEFTKSVMESFDESQRNELLDLLVMPLECDLEPQTGAIKLSFITHDPTRPEIPKLLQQLKLERFELCYAPEAVVKALIAETFPRKNEYLERMGEGGLAFDIGTSYEESASLIDEEALEAEISRSTLINLFEATLVEAVRQGASDVHIFPNAKKQVEIHFRIDGRLQKWMIEDKVHPEALLAVIKDNSMNVDRFEREAAQDGFIQRWIDDALIRFRVSVLPIANALQELRSESIVIRVLDDRKVITDLNKLGLLPSALERFSQAIRQPHGMVILTGPTGSGKSTTLVAALHQVVSPEVNVLTVEDPVEYIIPGVRQIKLNHKLTLDGALRAILRHDPDVVMVGEMRDRKTAEMGIKLANTGHLTFSTLHTNDAPSAITRLYKMGIEPFLIAYAINLVVAQRLVRVACPTCKKVDEDPDDVLLRKLGFTAEQIATTTFYNAVHDRNCPTCKGVGYKGRRAICEALYFSRNIRHMIADAEAHLDEGRIRDQAIKEGMLTLKDSAREYVMRGETDVKEMIRVTTTDEG